MKPEWDELDTEEAARKIISSALSVEAEKVLLASDSEGATVFFNPESSLVCYDRLPLDTSRRLSTYFRQLGGIDDWEDDHAIGYGSFEVNGRSIRTTIKTIPVYSGLDVIIDIS